jgi:hypothetical protein
MITFGTSMRLCELNTGVLQPSPLKEISSRDYKHQGGFIKDVTHASLRREKLRILGTEEFLSLPCSLFLKMTAPLNLVESNRPSPYDLVLLTQHLYWMLWIRKVSIEGRNIVNDDINRRLQTFLQLRDVEHVMHTYQGWRQLQSVRYIPHPSQDRKWTDVTWCQLSFDAKPLNMSRR